MKIRTKDDEYYHNVTVIEFLPSGNAITSNKTIAELIIKDEDGTYSTKSIDTDQIKAISEK